MTINSIQLLQRKLQTISFSPIWVATLKITPLREEISLKYTCETNQLFFFTAVNYIIFAKS